MNGEQSSALQSFRRVREYLGAHTPAGMPASFAMQVAELDHVIAQLSRSSQEQNASTRAGVVEVHRQRALREALWNDHLVPLSRLARDIFGVPGMDAALRLPRKSADNERLLSAARGMADAAERQRAAFTSQGLAEDFVESLRGAATALEQALGARVETGRQRVKATAEVRVLVQRGGRAVRMLDALLRPKLSPSPELLAAWRDARRRKGAGGRPPVVVDVEAPEVVKVA